MYPKTCRLDPKSLGCDRSEVDRRTGAQDDRFDGEASGDRARQVAQGRSRRARRHLPLRRARLRRDPARRPGAVPLVRGLHPARGRVCGQRRPRPVRGDRRAVHAAHQVPRRRCDLGAAAPDRPAGGALRPRHGRHHHASEHPAAQPDDRGSAGRAGRAERRRAVVHPGLRRRLAQHRRLPAGRRGRARAAGHAAADRGDGARFRRQPRVLEPAAQVQGVGQRLRPSLRAARDQRHRAGRGRERRRRRLRRVGGRRARRLGSDGPPAGRVRRAGRGGRRVPGDHRAVPRRGQAHQADAGPDQVSGRRVGRRALARRDRGEAAPRAADVGRPRPADRSSPRPPGHPPAGGARPLLRRRHHAARPVPGRPDDRRRRHRRPLRLGAAALHQPPERDRA